MAMDIHMYVPRDLTDDLRLTVKQRAVEGIATVVAALAAFFLLHDFPETAQFLTEEERAFVVFRLKYQGQSAKLGPAGPRVTQVAQADEFKWKYVSQAFLDWQIWVNIFVYWGVSINFRRLRPELSAEKSY